MSSRRIVSVFGATGTQGSAVVRALLKDGTFTPRAITRNPGSEAALELKKQGAQVVKGDSLDKASLVEALRGSEAVFGVTDPIFPIKAEGEGPNEVDQGKNMVDAAKEVGVKFFVFSSLPSVNKITNGKYKNLLHYEQKAVVEEYLRSSGLANASLHTCMFLENYWKFGLLKKTDTGFDVAVPFFKPTDRQTFTWIERDMPAALLALLKNYTEPSKSISGKAYPIVNARKSYTELTALTSKVLGVKVTFSTAPPMGVPELDGMYKCHTEYEGFFTETPLPNPELVALGVKFGTIQEFLETEVKPRFA
ncbi:hypothetical protein DFH06DRAFT_767307 [Mycena polygramma]|nr:hypothetical protein DFH06DRAFT_767307 [Mycena polygramma]